MGKWAMVPAPMRENAAADMAGVKRARSIVVARPTWFLQATIDPLNGIIAGQTAIATERPAIAVAMDIIGITIIIMVLGINTATKGEDFYWER